MDVAQVATTTVAAVGPALPYLLKVGESIAEEATKALGKGAWDCAKAVWDRLRPKLNGHAQKVAEKLAAAPDDEDVRGALRMELRDILAADQKLTDDLRALLKGAGRPNLSVVASGQGAVAVGRDASGATIITGNQNTVAKN